MFLLGCRWAQRWFQGVKMEPHGPTWAPKKQRGTNRCHNGAQMAPKAPTNYTKRTIKKQTATKYKRNQMAPKGTK